MSFIGDLISILGKDISAPEVLNIFNTYGLQDVYDDPPGRRYIGSAAKGVDLLFDNNRLIDIQIFVQESTTHSAFSEDLPFGLRNDMTDDEVYTLLGHSHENDLVGRKYSILDGQATMTIVRDSEDVMSYLSLQVAR